MHSKLLIGTVFLSLGLSGAGANTIVAGYDFQDSAFADSVISSSGSFTLIGAGTLSAAVTGSGLTKYAFNSPILSGANIQLGFTDNYLVNGTGYDLALFEFGTPSSFAVTIGGKTLNYLSASTGFTSVIGGTTYAINVAKINLDDFGITAGSQLSSVLIGMGIGSSVPSLSVVGALNSAPAGRAVPDAGSTVSMLGLGFLAFGLLKKKP